MIKLNAMKIGIRKDAFHQFSMRWGDCFVDGWEPFPTWFLAGRFAQAFRLNRATPSHPLFKGAPGIWDGIYIHITA